MASQSDALAEQEKAMHAPEKIETTRFMSLSFDRLKCDESIAIYKDQRDTEQDLGTHQKIEKSPPTILFNANKRRWCGARLRWPNEGTTLNRA